MHLHFSIFCTTAFQHFLHHCPTVRDHCYSAVYPVLCSLLKVPNTFSFVFFLSFFFFAFLLLFFFLVAVASMAAFFCDFAYATLQARNSRKHFVSAWNRIHQPDASESAFVSASAPSLNNFFSFSLSLWISLAVWFPWLLTRCSESTIVTRDAGNDIFSGGRSVSTPVGYLIFFDSLRHS